jgi:hypothetical protein
MKGRRRRRWLWLLAALCVLVLTAAGVLAFGYPSVAATTCPRCYGLVALQDRLYAERGLSGADRQKLIDLYRDANQQVSGFYEGRLSTPKVLACVTDGCYDRVGGGGERGIAVLNQAVLLSPRGLDPVIAAHELSHVEFHKRLGARREQVPQWFDEGLAVLVSNDSRYLLPDKGSDRCRVVSDEPLPTSLSAWLSAAGADQQMYAKAACRVSRWVDANGGNRAVLNLIDRLNHGEPFASMVPG